MNENIETAFLDFYKTYNVIPVNQDVKNLSKHFSRRKALFLKCGIPPLMLQGKDVLEVGPGTGHNALFTNSLSPRSYTFIDGLKLSLTETKKNLDNSFNDISNCVFIESDLRSLNLKEEFDFVLCEGVIPGQNNPKEFNIKLSSYVKPGGVLLITCSDSVSMLSEILRRFMGEIIAAKHGFDLYSKEFSLSQKVKVLSPIFDVHLQSLKHRSRFTDDWVIDCIIQPFLGQLFSIADAIHSISNKFEVYSALPNFYNDWRWYKSMIGEAACFNSSVCHQYYSNVHNFLNCNSLLQPVEESIGYELINVCNRIFVATSKKDLDVNERASNLLDLINQLITLSKKYKFQIHNELDDYINFLQTWLANSDVELNLPLFKKWWGRGQAYVSFIRR